MPNARVVSDIVASRSADYNDDVIAVLTALGIEPTEWVRNKRISRIWEDPSPLLAAAGDETNTRDAAEAFGYNVDTGGNAQTDAIADVTAWLLLAAETAMVSVQAPFALAPLAQLVADIDPANAAIDEYANIREALYELALANNNLRGAANSLIELQEVYLTEVVVPATDSVNAVQIAVKDRWESVYIAAGWQNRLFDYIVPTNSAAGTWETERIRTNLQALVAGINDTSLGGAGVAGFRAAVDTTTLGGGYAGNATTDDLSQLLNFLADNLPQ